MGVVEGALSQLGVDVGAVEQVSSAIGEFGNQDVSLGDIIGAAQTIGGAIGGDVGAAVSGVASAAGQIAGIAGAVASGVAGVAATFGGSSGVWQSTRYAYDLNRHHPKLKFLFKVGFYGFVPDVRDFYFFVSRIEKPKVKIIHQDVNYYNFRTRVKTSTVFDPLTIEFLDEIGDTVNTFFVEYMKAYSGTGGGNYGIDDGFGASSSSFPYEGNNPGYGAGRYILLEQIFANGTKVNKFRFLNPRIESFDFNELTMEESAGSLMTVQFSYDAIQCETAGSYENPTWGDTDLLRGGGTSGPGNGGSSSLGESGSFSQGSASGSGIGSASGSGNVYQGGLLSAAGSAGGSLSSGGAGASGSPGQFPGSLSNLISQGSGAVSAFTHAAPVGSDGDVVSSAIQDTLQSIVSGDNLQFNGAATGAYNDRRYSGDVLTDAKAAVDATQIFPG